MAFASNSNNNNNNAERPTPSVTIVGTSQASIAKLIVSTTTQGGSDLERTTSYESFTEATAFHFTSGRRTVELVPVIEEFSLLTRGMFGSCAAIVLTFSINDRRSFELVTTSLYRDIQLARDNSMPLTILCGTFDSSVAAAERQVSEAQATAFANSIGTRYFEVDVDSPASVRSPLEFLIALIPAALFTESRGTAARRSDGGVILRGLKKLFRKNMERSRSGSQ